MVCISFTSFSQIKVGLKDESKATIAISPCSLPIWGKTPSIARYSFEYNIFEVVYLHAYDILYDPKGGAMNRENYAIFIKPIHYEYKRLSIAGGIGYYLKGMPTVNCNNINFQFQVDWNLTRNFGIRYTHNSDGFGVFNWINPGLDNISITITL